MNQKLGLMLTHSTTNTALMEMAKPIFRAEDDKLSDHVLCDSLTEVFLRVISVTLLTKTMIAAGTSEANVC